MLNILLNSCHFSGVSLVNKKLTRGGLVEYSTLCNINNRVIKDYRITSFNTSVL